MNLAKIKKLRDHLKKLASKRARTNKSKKPGPSVPPGDYTKDTGFNMGTEYSDAKNWTTMSGHDCGAVACLAGHACLMEGIKPIHITMIKAAEILDLTREQRTRLFMPDDYTYDNRYPIERAIETLDRIIKTKKFHGWVRLKKSPVKPDRLIRSRAETG